MTLCQCSRLQLTFSQALDFRQWLGGEEKINRYCHALAIAGGKRVAQILHTHVMDSTAQGKLPLNMVRFEHMITGRAWA